MITPKVTELVRNGNPVGKRHADRPGPSRTPVAQNGRPASLFAAGKQGR